MTQRMIIRRVSLALLSLLVLTASAWADPVPMTRTVGQVFVNEAGQVEARFEDGEIMVLDNVVVRGRRGDAGMYYIYKKADSDADGLVMRLGNRVLATPTRPFDELRVGKIVHNGIARLLWVGGNERFTANDIPSSEVRISPLTDSGNGHWRVDASVYGNNTFGVSIQNIFYGPYRTLDGSQILISGFDPAVHAIRSFSVDLVTGDVKDHHNFMLPASVDFSQVRQLYVSPESRNALLETTSGLRIEYFRPERDHELSSRNMTGNWEWSGRPLWEAGRQGILTYLGQVSPADSVEQPEATTQLQGWLQNSQLSMTTDRRAGVASRQATLLWGKAFVYSWSDALIRQRPQFVNRLVYSAVQAAGSRPVLFLKVPQYVDRQFLRAIREQFDAFLSQNPSELSPLLILDVQAYRVPFVRPNTVNPVEEMLEDLTNRRATDFRTLILARHSQEDARSLTERFSHLQLQAFDAILPRSERLSVIQAEVERNRSTPISNDVLDQVLSRLESEAVGTGELFSDLGLAANRLALAATSEGLDPAQEGYPEQIARAYAQISGQRRVGPFSTEMLRRARQLPRVVESGYRLTGLDEILQHISARTLSWMAHGHQQFPILPFYMAGHNGTGKSTVAEAMVEALGAASEVVNLSTFSEAASRSSSFFSAEPGPLNHTSGAYREIEAKVQQLALNPNPLKVLVLEEMHRYPEVLNDLLPAFGDTDRRGSRTLDFSGLIVVMIGNINVQNSAYVALQQMNPTHPDYARRNLELFTATYAGQNGERTSLAQAVGARIQGGLLTFPPIELDSDAQRSRVDRLIRDYERNNQVHLIVRESAQQRLADLAQSYSDGNYRSVERALNAELGTALGRYRVAHGADRVEGSFILDTRTERGRRGVAQRVSLELIPVDQNDEGLLSLVDDTYERFSRANRAAMDESVAAFSGEDGLIAEEARSQLTARLNAYERLTRDALMQIGPAQAAVRFLVPALALPAGMSLETEQQMMAYVTDQIRPLFSVDAPSIEDASARLGRVQIALTRLQAYENASGRSERPFAQWVESVRQAYQTAGNVEIPANSSEALAVASAYLVDHVGRQLAEAQLSDLRKQMRDRLLLNPQRMGADDGNLSAQCELMMTAARSAGEEIDAILGSSRRSR